MIRVTDLAKSYGRVEALRGVSFEIPAGETLGIIGPNGAGKTTLLKILLGLVRPNRGSVHVHNLDLKEEPVAVRRLIGYVPQTDGFDEAATGREALRFLARLRGAKDIEGPAAAVGVMDLLDRPIGTLSGGQRQRVSLAAALIGDPPVLLLDEPTASLDPRANADFRNLMRRLAAEGRTLVLCSHLLADVEQLCGQVLVLLEGRVAAMETVNAAVPSLRLEVDDAAASRQVLRGFPAASWVNGVSLETPCNPDATHLLLALREAGVIIKGIEARRATLEERFLKHVADERKPSS